MKNLIIGLVLIAILGVVLYFAPRNSQAPTNNNGQTVTVEDFQSCVAAGYQLTGTAPQICTTPQGVQYSDNTVAPDVVIDTPVVAQVVTSPLTIKGKARGTWFFEANLPIVLKDENGNVLAQKGYMTSENWMTEDYVNIDTTLSFKAPATDYGVLVIEKDNPSGLPENDKSFSVPVRFR